MKSIRFSSKPRRFWFVLGALAAFSYGAASIACSSSKSNGLPGSGDDASTTSDGSASSGDDGSTAGDDGSTGAGSDSGGGTDSGKKQGDGGAGDCGKAPSLFPPKADGGIYCPFSGVDGGKSIDCPRTDQCCETPKGAAPSTCETKGSACPVANSTVWECADPIDCPSGQQCCAHSGDAGTVTIQTDTCGPYLSKFAGTRCADSCGTGELVVCEKQSECEAGTCTAVKPKGNDIGVCN